MYYVNIMMYVFIHPVVVIIFSFQSFTGLTFLGRHRRNKTSPQSPNEAAQKTECCRGGI